MPYTLTVNFTLANPDPGSYRVKFWPTSNTSNITTRLVSNSPFIESNLPETSYAGTIEASCGSGQYSSPVSFDGTAPVTNLYLTAQELDLGVSGNGIKWLLANSVGSSTGNTTVPFDIRIAYYADGTGISGGMSTPLLISGLELVAGQQEVQQGTTATDWSNVHTVSVAFREPLGSWSGYTAVVGPTGTLINQPLLYTRPNGSQYSFSITRNSFAILQ